MAPDRRGLTLGKYAPLHRGHQLVIETALREMDEVTVIVYDAPETTSIPLSVRAGWVRRLHPDVRVIEAWDGPTEVGDTPEIRARHERYVLDRLKIRSVTHFYSGEFYGEHMARALGAVDRRVDPERRKVPVSASQIRADPYAWRRYVDPTVYRDLVTNVVLLGAPCTGKTTLAERLAAEFGTAWMPEFGREYWVRHQVDRRLTPEQLVEIAEGHLEREERRLADANRYLFTDTNAVTTFVFSRHYHGHALPKLAALADAAAARYDLVFLCDTDVPNDGAADRSGDADRLVHQKRVIDDLRRRRTPYHVLRGDLASRVAQVRAVLSRHVKFMNPADLRLPSPSGEC